MQEIKKFVAGFVTCHSQPPHQWIGGHAVDGKHVDIDTGHIVAVSTFYQCRTAVHHLAESAREGGAGLYTERFQWLGQPFVGMHHKPVVVRTWHTDVHIVVPGDKALVADSTQHGARPTVVFDVVFAADPIHAQKNLQDVLV